ncbi:MAG: hypothetical protein NVSMB9_08520 [Isosphaeraceae bacterium]
MVGEKLGSFRIDGTLGVGAMGVVYQATHEPTGKTAAVKVVNKEVLSRGKAYERFQREAEILKQFRHENIVRFLALGRSQGISYIAMEFVPGKTLDQLLQEHGPFDWKEVVELGIQMCDALHYAHEHGVVHRDFKPSNLMVTEAGRIKLTDFGIAKDLDKTALTATGRTLGTAAYMAPEQIRGTPEVSHKTDIYALGVVFYQVLTGQPPFDGNSAVVLMHAHLNEPAPRPSGKVAEIPRSLDDLVVQLMAKSPTDRPWDAAAVGETLKKIQEQAKRGVSIPMVWPTAGINTSGFGSTSTTAKKTTKGGRGRKTGFRRFVTVRALETLALFAALLGIGGFVGYMFWPPSMLYLYKHAEILMARPDRHEWYEARDTYLEPLDRRFPGHPYRKQVQAWRDQILLSDAENRALLLQSEANLPINRPANKSEQRYAEYYSLITAADKRGDHLSAVASWEELASLYRPDDREERPWYLLARKRAEDLRVMVKERRELVSKLLAEATNATLAGRLKEAESIQAEVWKRYGRYQDLADLLGTDSANASGHNVPPNPTPSPPSFTPPSLPLAEHQDRKPDESSEPKAATPRVP